MIISAATAADNNTNSDTSDIQSVQAHTSINKTIDDVNTLSQQKDIKDNTKKLDSPKKISNKETKKASYTVDNYDQLYNTIESIKSSSETETTINLNQGTYQVTNTINWTGSNTKTLTINGNGQTIDGQNHQFITVAEGYTLNLKNLIINNCQASDGAVIYVNNSKLTVENITASHNTASHSGAFCYLNQGTVEITNSSFKNHHANNGGVNYVRPGTMTIVNSTFENNNVDVDAGANVNYGVMTIINSSFTNNTALSKGGANWNDGNLTIEGCIFTNNSANQGGANSNRNNKTIINNSTFINNTATEGGANYNYNNVNLVINNSNFTDNNATNGAVNYNQDLEYVVINNSVFENNIASLGNGGVNYNNNTSILNITDSSFINNTAKNGSVNYNSNAVNVNIKNSTFTLNHANENGGVNYNIGGNINITNSSFINNMALNGSVNYNTNSAILNIIQSEFKDNTANDKGGINYNNKSYMNITDSKFTNNTGVVGGINFNNNSYVNITNVNFTNNKARSNSSINYNENTNITILDSNFTNNTSGPVGINSNVNTNITLQNLIFTNITFSGYGMEKSVNSTQIVQNVTYINTRSSGTGGVFEASDSTIIMDNVIFNQTSSAGPGGVFNITNTTVNATNVNFTDCNASNGGVFNTLNSRINLTNVNFTRCNSTSGNGGVISSTNSNITISNANFNTTYSRSTGGAFSIRNTNLNITNVNFTNTKAGSPGGIVDFTSSNVSIIDSNINDTSAMMGSIFYSGTSNNLTIKSTNITNTVATSAPGAVGYLSGNDNIIVENTLINETISTNVGGLFYIGGSSNILKIKSSNITKTQINANGPGAIYLGGNSNLIIEDSQFSSNTAAGIGCVIYNSQGNVEIRNSNFTDNNQTTENLMGGVIYNDKGQLNIENSIFTNTLNQNNTIYSNADITLINVTLNNTITTPKAYEENTYYTPIQVDTLSENEDITITVDNQIFTTNKNATTNITSFNYTFSTSGDKTIKMSYPTYADSNINLLMDNVEAVDIIEIQPVSDIRVFDKITVDVTLKKADGTLFTDELPVAFKIGDKIYKNTTITGGQTTQEIDTSTLPVGDYDVVVIVGVENQTQFTIIKRDIEDKTITIDEIKTFENTTIDLTINDEMGTQLIGSIPVEVLVNGTSVLNTTIVDGVLKDTISTDTLAGGEYDVEFRIEESDIYNAKTLTSKLNILKRDVIVDITSDVSEVKPLHNITFTITVTDENTTQPVKEGQVVLKFDNNEITTLDLKDGKATYTYTIPANVTVIPFMPYTVEADYITNNYYNKASNNLPVDVIKMDIADTTITLDDIKVFENSHVDVIINDELGNALLGNIPVEVVVNGTSILNTTIVDGVLKDTIPTENLPAGEYSVEFNVQPDEFGIYNEKILTSKLNIIKRDAILTVEADTTKVLNTLAINVTLNDENMTINSGNVVFKINNKVVRDENGNPIKVHVKDNKAQLNYTLPQEIGQGQYNITAVYESNNYNKVENTTQCNIEGLDIEVKDMEMTIKAKTQTVINITLYDENGVQLIGTIKGVIKLNDKTFMNTTIKDGVLCEVLDTQTQKVGNHKITVKLGENSLYNAEEFNINLTIIKRDANISISTNTPTTSGNLIVDVNVTDNEKQIDSGVVSFKINGKTLLDENNNTITVNVTEDGKAHLNYILPSYIGSGEYNITAVYSDKNYNRVDVTDNFNVDKSAIGNITADKITTPKGENTTINMTIKDAQGREIYGKTKIAIKIDGATVLNTYIYDGMLNVDLITEKTKVGNHNITVVLGENSRYLTGNILIPLEITG